MNMGTDYRIQPGPLGEFSQRQQIRPQPRPITPEELQEWNSCVRESLYKGGLPFAVGMHFFNAFMKSRAANKTNIPSGPPPPIERWPGLKPKIVFVGNFFVGLFLYTPVCYKRLQAKFYATQQNLLKEKEETSIATKAEGATFRTEDISFHSLDHKLDGLETNFSHLDLDFDSSISDKLISEDVQDQKSKQSISETTYDDLRRRNRENFSKKLTSPVPPVRDDPKQSSYPGVVQKPSPDEPWPRKVAKNKYGDDMEI